MKSLARLALGALFAGMLAVTPHVFSMSCTTSGWNGSGGVSQIWSVTAPAMVNINTSVTVTANANGGGGGSSITRNGAYVTGASVTISGTGTKADSKSATGQPSGNYGVGHGFGGPPNSVYANITTTLSW